MKGDNAGRLIKYALLALGVFLFIFGYAYSTKSDFGYTLVAIGIGLFVLGWIIAIVPYVFALGGAGVLIYAFVNDWTMGYFFGIIMIALSVLTYKLFLGVMQDTIKSQTVTCSSCGWKGTQGRFTQNGCPHCGSDQYDV